MIIDRSSALTTSPPLSNTCRIVSFTGTGLKSNGSVPCNVCKNDDAIASPKGR